MAQKAERLGRFQVSKEELLGINTELDKLNARLDFVKVHEAFKTSEFHDPIVQLLHNRLVSYKNEAYDSVNKKETNAYVYIARMQVMDEIISDIEKDNSHEVQALQELIKNLLDEKDSLINSMYNEKLTESADSNGFV